MAFTTFVSGGPGEHETPQQEVTRYNNYKTICRGLRYQYVRCDDITKYQTDTNIELPLVNSEIARTKECFNFDYIQLNISVTVLTRSLNAWDRLQMSHHS